ncbi:MAG TPA: hypothetical protein VGF71_16745 [Caulobacteraceae bacterium]|jgi:hypothetical protein
MASRKTSKKAPSAAKREPTPEEWERITLAATRFGSRPKPVAMTWTPAGVFGFPHNDEPAERIALHDALGTSSLDFVKVSLGQLECATRERCEERGESIAELNAALALVEAIAPQNELEAALAVHMAGVNNLAAEMLGLARHSDLVDHIALFGGLAVKLARTFAAQIEALAKLRGGGKQQVEVRHVYVNGNAVIGDVHGGGGGDAETERRPHAPALTNAPGDPVRGSFEADRQAMPSAGRERTDAL